MSQKSSLPPNPISHAGRQDPRHSHSVSGALSIVGGFIGAVFGVGASLLISRLADWGAAVGPGAVLFAVFFSALVGIGFGYYPARKAAYLDPTVAVRFELFRVCALGSWVIGANMQCKLFVALQLEVAHHFIERCAGGRTRRFEPPATFGATKTPKTRLFNPHQFPAHGRLCRCAPSPSEPMPGTRLPSREETFWVRHNVPFPRGVLPDCSRNLWAQRKMCKRDGRSLHVPIWMVCRASYILGRFLVRANARVRGLV
jgi:hypothetical protein